MSKTESENTQVEDIKLEFDVEYYLRMYPDVAKTNIDPIDHYWLFGWREGRDPAPAFSTLFYLEENPDVRERGLNPFWHYLVAGRAEGRRGEPPADWVPSRLRFHSSLKDMAGFTSIEDIRSDFDSDFYLSMYQDVANSNFDPVEHYWIFGWREDRDPCRTFSTAYYLQSNPDVSAANINPFWHFLVAGRNEGRLGLPPGDEAEVVIEGQLNNPNEWAGSIHDIEKFFDVRFYLSKYKDVADANVNPLEHYWNTGWTEGRDPSPDFSTSFYLEMNPDVAGSKINPFWHFIVAGKGEGRTAVHPGGARFEKLRVLETLETEVHHWSKGEYTGTCLVQSEIERIVAGNAKSSKRQLVVSVSHDNYLKVSGGIQLCVQMEQKLAVERGISYLNIHPWQPIPRLGDLDEDADPVMVLTLDGEEIGTARISALTAALSKLSKHFKVIRTIVHHLLGHLPENVVRLVSASGSNECWLWLHDFFTLCPSFTLQRNGITYCGAPNSNSNACTLCRYGAERKHHLVRIEEFFTKLKVHVLSPSEVTSVFWKSKFPVQPASLRVIPHMILDWRIRERRIAVSQKAPITVGFLGTPAYHKGWDLFERLARDNVGNESLRFVFFGNTEIFSANIESISVHVTADRPNAMVEAVRNEGCDFVVHWASWPETFSFSTYEALAGGAYVLTNPISGNVAVTVEKLGRGAILNNEEELRMFFADGPALKMTKRIRGERQNKKVEFTYSKFIFEAFNM